MSETASGNEFVHGSVRLTEGAGCGKGRMVCHNGLAATSKGGKKRQNAEAEKFHKEWWDIPKSSSPNEEEQAEKD